MSRYGAASVASSTECMNSLNGSGGWFSSWRTVVPRMERFEVPSDLKIREKPAFLARTSAWLDMKRDGDFCARLRLNATRCPVTEKHGGRKWEGGKGNGHTFGRYLPAKEFFSAHPEYFAEVNGRRNPNQPCLSNPDVLAIFKQRVLDWIRRYPDGEIYMVTQNDCEYHCHCERCRATDEYEGSPSGSMLRFVNAIAEEVEKEFPDKLIETYAYMYSQKPPIHVRPRRNVMIYLCNDGSQGPPYMNRHKTLDEQRDAPFSFAKTLEAWSRIADKIHIFDYNTNFTRSLYAFPIELTFAPNLRLYRDCGVKFVNGYGGVYTLHADFAELKLWLYAKLAWNPDQDVESLLRRFFGGYYGRGAPQARKVFDILQREYPADRSLGMFQKSVAYSEETLAKCARLWDEALARVRGDEGLEYNVRMAALPVAYMRFEKRPVPKRFFVTRNPAAFSFKDGEAVALVRQLKEAMSICKDIRLAESSSDAQWQLDRLDRVEATKVPAVPSDRLVLEEKAFTRLAWSNRARFEVDAKAHDGQAMRCFNLPDRPAAEIPLQDVAFDPDVAYRIRFRARIERGESADGDAAFSLRVKNPSAAASVCKVCKVSETGGEEYVWYELPKWIPSEREFIYFARGAQSGSEKARTVKNAWLDCLEIVRVE